MKPTPLTVRCNLQGTQYHWTVRELEPGDVVAGQRIERTLPAAYRRTLVTWAYPEVIPQWVRETLGDAFLVAPYHPRTAAVGICLDVADRRVDATMPRELFLQRKMAHRERPAARGNASLRPRPGDAASDLRMVEITAELARLRAETAQALEIIAALA